MDADLIQHQVSIPGIEPPTTVFAVDQDEALREALDMHGLHFAPVGTTVTPRDDDLRHQPRPAAAPITQGKPQ